jgi:GxxExxY protein
MEPNEVSGEIVGAAIRVHRELGPRLLERTYEACLVHELRKRGLRAQNQVGLPVVYDGVRLETGYRIDLLVEELVIVEIKSVVAVEAIHKAQLLSYLRLSKLNLGLLLNFNVRLMRQGISRVVNRL